MKIEGRHRNSMLFEAIPVVCSHQIDILEDSHMQGQKILKIENTLSYILQNDLSSTLLEIELSCQEIDVRR